MPNDPKSFNRLAAYEILHMPQTPQAVVMNEAIEIAKRYSTAESSQFVNGVLAAVAARAEAQHGGAL